jgi:CheY-like chemotaxis protein
MSEKNQNYIPGGETVPQTPVDDVRKKLIATQISQKADLELKANTGPADNLTGNDKRQGNLIRKILIVDDVKMTIDIMDKFLLSLGYTVRTARSAKDGMEILTREEIDLVITDINMPGINGIDFFLWIKKNIPLCQVIIMTAFGSEELKEFASQKGALRYFEKPMNGNQLKNLIAELNADKKNKNNLVDINLFDFVRMNILLYKQKRLLIKDPVTGLVARLFLAGGAITHAECENLKGLKAFNAIVSMKKGEFVVGEWKDPPEKTIEAKPLRLFQDSINLIEENDHEITNIIFFAKQLNDLSARETSLPKEPVSGFNNYESGIVTLINIGKTARKEVIEIMKNFSSLDYSGQLTKPLYIYAHLSLSIRFDVMGKVQELNFGSRYKGKVVNGLSIGDTVAMAAKVLGAPNYSSEKGVLWDNVAVLHNSANVIEYLRLT